jgi:hypothetical protein
MNGHARVCAPNAVRSIRQLTQYYSRPVTPSLTRSHAHLVQVLQQALSARAAIAPVPIKPPPHDVVSAVDVVVVRPLLLRRVSGHPCPPLVLLQLP